MRTKIWLATLSVAVLAGPSARADGRLLPQLQSKIKNAIGQTKELVSANADVKRLKLAHPDMKTKYNETFQATRRGDGFRLISKIWLGTSAGLTTAAVAAGTSPVGALAIGGLGGALLAKGRHEANKAARMAVIDAALANPELRDKLSPETVNYYTRQVSQRMAKQAALLQRTEELTAALRKDVDESKEKLARAQGEASTSGSAE
jgi:hypothetical protein